MLALWIPAATAVARASHWAAATVASSAEKAAVQAMVAAPLWRSWAASRISTVPMGVTRSEALSSWRRAAGEVAMRLIQES